MFKFLFFESRLIGSGTSRERRGYKKVSFRVPWAPSDAPQPEEARPEQGAGGRERHERQHVAEDHVGGERERGAGQAGQARGEARARRQERQKGPGRRGERQGEAAVAGTEERIVLGRVPCDELAQAPLGDPHVAEAHRPRSNRSRMAGLALGGELFDLRLPVGADAPPAP
jgi:hypothetical protein